MTKLSPIKTPNRTKNVTPIAFTAALMFPFFLMGVIGLVFLVVSGCASPSRNMQDMTCQEIAEATGGTCYD